MDRSQREIRTPEDIRRKAQDVKDHQRSQYRKRSKAASARGQDPDLVEEARLMKWFNEKSRRRPE